MNYKKQIIKCVILIFFIVILIPGVMNSQETNIQNMSKYIHEADGLCSEVLYTFCPEDSTIDVTCNLKNIAEHSVYFVGYSMEKPNSFNTYKDYFRIECGNVSKTCIMNGSELQTGFYDTETVYIHLEFKTFLHNNHVLSKEWCFGSELKPGKVFGTKAKLKVDILRLKNIDVSIDFLFKTNINEDFMSENDIKFHRYKIPLTGK